MEYISANAQIHGHSVRNTLFILLLYIGCVFSLHSQTPLSTSDKKAKKLYAKAEKCIKERDFKSAIALFQESIKRDPNFYESYLRVGSLYNALGNLDSVYSNFIKYTALSPNPSQAVLRRLAFMSFDRGEYNQSKNFLTRYLDIKPEMKSEKEIVLLNESISFAQEQLLNETNLVIKKLPEAINRFDLQYLPAITIDNSTMIFTKRDFVDDSEDIVVSYRKNGKWSPAVSISSKINSPLNEGACTISADGKTMIFTSCDRRDSFGSCDLYISRKVNGEWSWPKNLGEPINTHYWESQPSLSADGRSLYFSSNRPGGKGGRDLWKSHVINGKWTKPVNLGDVVNSSKDETTPFIHPNNESLYFSSNGFIGMGGYDLYKSQFQDSVWLSPENLGFPINTYRDEVALLIDGEGKTAYFAKEKQKNNEILESEIVKFLLPDELKVAQASYIIGKVIDADLEKPLKAKVEVIDIDTNQKLFESNSDSLTGEYLMVLPTNKELAGYVKKKGYLYSDFHFISSKNSVLEPDTILIQLNKVVVGSKLVLKNVYFDTDSYEIDARSDSEIASVIELLNENPTIQIEIGGHTDDVGSKSYNYTLSRKRAQTIFDKLVVLGIDSSRLSFKGYADEMPIHPNTNNSNRQSNRRIEFSVIRDE